MSKKTPRKNTKTQSERSEEMLKAILIATERVLIKRGYAGTTTNHIAEVAGISIGSFYRYYSKKEDAVAVLLKHQTMIGEELLLKGLSEPQNLGLEEMALKVVDNSFNFYCEHEALWNIFYYELPKQKEFKILSEHFERCGIIIETFLTANEEKIKFQNPKIVSSIIVHSMVGAFFGTNPELRQKENKAAFLKEIQALVIQYIFGNK